jgi:hypothetical protein
MKDKKIFCLGCERSFKSTGGLNSHKRFCKNWQDIKHRYQRKHKSLEETKTSESMCPYCKKTFVNIYSMSAHKGHCSGKTPKYKDLSEDQKNKMAWSRGKTLQQPNDIFCISEKKRTGYVKKSLFNLGIKEHICENCHLKEWIGQQITLELDHINGNNLDNRLENLRLLCPNCHSQTETWRGRNKNNQQNKII